MSKASTAEYEKSSEGSATVFRVTPAKAPKFMSLVVFGAVVAFGGLLAGAAGFFFILMGGFAIWYGWSRDQRPKEHKSVSTFRVTPDSIEVHGRTFRKDDIHRLILRNGITDQELNVEMYNVSAAQASGIVQRAKIGQVCNALTLEAGGKATFLAGGMDETTAYGLLHDVSKIIGFNK